MGFDRNTLCNGVEIYCDLQNGKAFLEWKFYLENWEAGDFIQLFVYDREGELVLSAMQKAAEEELLQTVLLHPRLWKGVAEPYLYRADIWLMREKQDRPADELQLEFPVRSFRRLAGKGWFLNGEVFVRKPVRYVGENEEEINLLLEMGANTVFLPNPGAMPASFYQMCERKGLIAWYTTEKAVDSRILKKGGRRTAAFYAQKALFSEEPFVYISKESIQCDANGSYSVTVYSSLPKTALYVNGILFEFQTGKGEFVFREIPFRGLFLCLTAEAGDCRFSLTVHKDFLGN